MTVWISHQEAARVCGGMATRTLYNLVSLGIGPTKHKDGRRNVYDEAEVKVWFETRVDRAERAA